MTLLRTIIRTGREESGQTATSRDTKHLAAAAAVNQMQRPQQRELQYPARSLSKLKLSKSVAAVVKWALHCRQSAASPVGQGGLGSMSTLDRGLPGSTQSAPWTLSQAAH